MEKIEYKHRPISTLESLSNHLGIGVNKLIKLAATADKYYHQNPPQKKSDGGERITYRMSEPLKGLHTAIKIKIFNNTAFPRYLQGSIKDKEQPRSPHSDAEIHADARFLICTDVSKFFDSIEISHVEEMWKYLFGFPQKVANLLARLTTFEGHLLQGSPTSSYIANAIFWDLEPDLVEACREKSITYTRYVDDITLSTKKYIPNDELGEIVAKVYGMMLKKGIKPNRRKQKFKSAAGKMDVHNLVINAGRPTLGKPKDRQIRMDVFNCKKSAQATGRRGDAYNKSYASVKQKVHRQKKYNPNAAEKHLAELNKIQPLKPLITTDS